MPDVRISNPEVKIDMNNGESTTVPTGERWIVDISTVGGGMTGILNSAGQTFQVFADSRKRRVRLSGGDTIEAGANTRTTIRGDVIST